MKQHLKPILIEMIQTHPKYEQKYKQVLIEQLESENEQPDLTDEEKGEKYFLEYKSNGEIELYEENGTFYDHDNQDLLIATFFEKEQAEMVCGILNTVTSK